MASTSSLIARTRPKGKETSSGPDVKSETRLYVGNLHPSVDEYTLVTLYSKFGDLAKLDFLFHKSGPGKGQPRGYAFVEYRKKEEAMSALAGTHDKSLRGRRLVVTHANANQYAERADGPGPHRRRDVDIMKPTTLSLIKNAKKPQSTDAKIAAMEAKLAAMRTKKDSSAAATSCPSPRRQSGLPSAKGHGLPPKPPS